MAAATPQPTRGQRRAAVVANEASNGLVIRGADVRAWRTRVDLSQAELGRRLNLTRHAVSKWERHPAWIVPSVHYATLLDVLLAAQQEQATLTARANQLRAG